MSRDDMINKAAQMLSISTNKALDKAEDVLVDTGQAIYVRIYDGSVIVDDKLEYLMTSSRVDQDVLVAAFNEGQRNSYIKPTDNAKKGFIAVVSGLSLILVLLVVFVVYMIMNYSDSNTTGEDVDDTEIEASSEPTSDEGANDGQDGASGDGESDSESITPSPSVSESNETFEPSNQPTADPDEPVSDTNDSMTSEPTVDATDGETITETHEPEVSPLPEETNDTSLEQEMTVEPTQPTAGPVLE